jgi:hypothetical protein
MKKREAMTGLLLIGVGGLVLAGNLDLGPDLSIGRLWPVILIALGAGRMLFPDGGSRLSGLPLVLVGSIFLAHNYRVIHLQQSWPLFIVAAGISILCSALWEAPSKAGGKNGGQPS